MAFSPTELGLVDLNGLVTTADLLRAAVQVYQQCLSAEHTPIRDRVITEVIFVLDLVGRFAAKDVRKVQNLLEREVTVVKPWSLPYWRRPGANFSRDSPTTSAPETTWNIEFCIPGHIMTAAVSTLLEIKPTSFGNWMPVAWSLNTNVRKFLFSSPECPTENSRNMLWGRTASGWVFLNSPEWTK